MLSITFTGNLGADAVVKDVKDQKVINFSVASTKHYTNAAGEKKEDTTWIDCSLWRKTDNISNHLTKGKKVLIVGEPGTSAFMPKDGGEPRATLQCTVEEIEFI